MRCPQSAPNPSSKWRIISFSIEANPVLSRTAFAGPPGPAFSFSAYLQCLSSTSLRVETHWFSPIPVRRCPRIRSQLGHTPPTGPVWGFAGVRSLTRPPKPHTGPYTGFFAFPLYLFHFSPTGKSRSELSSVLLCPPEFVHNCPTRLQRGW